MTDNDAFERELDLLGEQWRSDYLAAAEADGYQGVLQEVSADEHYVDRGAKSLEILAEVLVITLKAEARRCLPPASHRTLLGTGLRS